MQLAWTGVRFELSCSKYDYPAAKAAGFHWDYKKRVAWTGRVDIAKHYEGYADLLAKEKLNQEKTQIKFSQAVDPSLISINEYEIPSPSSLSYLPFQKAGILVALSRLGFDIESLRKK